jgi:hypothetical protein
MTYPLAQSSVKDLREVLELLQDPANQGEATQKFAALVEKVTQTPEMAEFLTVMWSELVSARRSSAFWEQLSDVEKNMSDQLVASNIQLQQNYLRLVQEQ